MRVLLLHGTGGNHESSWFPWLKNELEALGHEVWVPDLPQADKPNIQRYNNFLLSNNWEFHDSLIVGHSSGSVAILGLLEALPKPTQVNTSILIGTFTERLSDSPSWGMLKELFEKPFDYETIKRRSGKFIFIHSVDDPYCPIEQAEELHQKLGGEFIRYTDKGHFSRHLDPQFEKFPELLEIIKQKVQ